MKFKESLKKYGCLPVATGLASVGLAVPAFAEGAAPTVVTASDWSSVISALTASDLCKYDHCSTCYFCGCWYRYRIYVVGTS